MRSALPARHIGAVGLIVSTLWLNVMRTLPARWQRLSVLRQLTQSTSEEQWQAVASLPRLGTTVQIGRLYLKERALVNRTLMRWIPGCPLTGGSSSQPRPWSNVTGPMSCGRVFPRLNKPSSARNPVPCRGLPFSSVPSSSPTRFAPQLFRVLLLRRFWLALPLSHLPVWPSIDVLGHHRAACSRAGVLRSRGFSLESAAARVCREAGAWVSTNLFLRDLPTMTPVVWRSLRTGFHCSAEPNWYHVSFVGAGRRQTSPAVCSRRRGSPLRSPPTQAAHVPGTLWDSGSRAVGGIGRRGGRPLV